MSKLVVWTILPRLRSFWQYAIPFKKIRQQSYSWKEIFNFRDNRCSCDNFDRCYLANCFITSGSAELPRSFQFYWFMSRTFETPLRLPIKQRSSRISISTFIIEVTNAFELTRNKFLAADTYFCSVLLFPHTRL